MIHVSAATTRRHLAFAPLIAALRQMFIGGCEVPQRHTHHRLQTDVLKETQMRLSLGNCAQQLGRHLGDYLSAILVQDGRAQVWPRAV